MKVLLIVVSLLLSTTLAWSQSRQRLVPYQGPTTNYQQYFIETPPPGYPAKAYYLHKKGRGLYRLTINPETGAVTEVKVVKSTGVKALDDSAAAALFRWKAKPHMVDHVVVPIDFTGPGEDTGSHIRW